MPGRLARLLARVGRLPVVPGLLYLSCGAASAAAVLSPEPIVRAFAVLALVSGMVSLAARRMHEMLGHVLASFGRIPAAVEVQRDEDGAAVYITRTDGELVIVRVPEEIAEDGPEAAIEWAVRETYEP